MSFQGDEYGKRTLDFVQRLQKLTRYEDICRHVVTELEWFGFTHVSSISLPGPGREATQCILMNTRPREYIDRYIEKNHVVRDPVVTELRRTVNPYSWSDERARRDLSNSEKAILDEGREFAAREIIGIYADQALKRAILQGHREEPAHTPLTPREREIMQWVATGKTDDEIGDILSIGATTVTSHVENAKQKLDAFRRTYAVVQALRFGEITL